MAEVLPAVVSEASVACAVLSAERAVASVVCAVVTAVGTVTVVVVPVGLVCAMEVPQKPIATARPTDESLDRWNIKVL